RATAAASCRDSLRSPWSIVTAMSFGLALSVSRQRAARTISAVESGPPDTASTMTGMVCRSEKSVFASDAETAFASAMRTLLFLRDTAFHAGRGLRIFAADFRQRRTSGLFLVHRGKRLTEAQQRVRRLAGTLELGRDAQERLGGVTIALLLKQAFAEP